MSTTHPLFLDRPGGRIAYDDTGDGPLVVCIPGMGDLRSEYRLLVPQLLANGHRVVTMDLRGHGQSDATFDDHERSTAGDDVVALLAHLDAGPAHLVGTSFGASAAVWAAAEAPERVASLTLVGPFVRDLPVPAFQSVMLGLALRRPWGARFWSWWLGTKLFPGATPDDHADHVAAVRRNLSEPGRLEAMAAMARSTCADIDPRLDDLAVPTLVVMGTADPDFPDPAAEAAAIAARVDGEVELVEGSGHYPQVDAPDVTGRAIMRFLASVADVAS
jgi:pimeloyl-ACP methyl ester carboxylesterase